MLRNKFEKIIRKLFFKYCYKPHSINAQHYNVIPIHSTITLNREYYDSGINDKLAKELLSKSISNQIMDVIKITKEYDVRYDCMVYGADLFVAEDKRLYDRLKEVKN